MAYKTRKLDENELETVSGGVKKEADKYICTNCNVTFTPVNAWAVCPKCGKRDSVKKVK